jgi:hypothetical protein
MGRTMVRVRASFIWLAILMGVGVLPAGSATGWGEFVEPQLGTSIDYPIGIFSVDEGVAPRGIGRQFRSNDGHAVLAVYSQNKEGENPARYVENNFKVPRQTIDYKRVTPTFFAISAVQVRFITADAISHGGAERFTASISDIPQEKSARGIPL